MRTRVKSQIIVRYVPLYELQFLPLGKHSVCIRKNSRSMCGSEMFCLLRESYEGHTRKHTKGKMLCILSFTVCVCVCVCGIHSYHLVTTVNVVFLSILAVLHVPFASFCHS